MVAWFLSTRQRCKGERGERKEEHDCRYHDFWPSTLIQKAQTDQSPQARPKFQAQIPLLTGQTQVSSHKHGSEPRPESRLMDYPITTKTCRIYCPDTSSPSRLPSLRRWSANNFPTDPSQLENTSSHESRT